MVRWETDYLLSILCLLYSIVTIWTTIFDVPIESGMNDKKKQDEWNEPKTKSHALYETPPGTSWSWLKFYVKFCNSKSGRN